MDDLFEYQSINLNFVLHVTLTVEHTCWLDLSSVVVVIHVQCTYIYMIVYFKIKRYKYTPHVKKTKTFVIHVTMTCGSHSR